MKKQDYSKGIPEIYYIKNDYDRLRNNSSWFDVAHHFKKKEKLKLSGQLV